MPKTPVSNRSFGLSVGSILIIIASFKAGFTGHANNLDLTLFALGFLLVSLGSFFPATLSAPNQAWMAFGEIAGKVVNPIVLFCLFILLVTPIGLLMRLLKARPLKLQIDGNTQSYWEKIKHSSAENSSMRDQF